MTAFLFGVFLIGLLYFHSQHQKHVWKSRWAQCLRDAGRIVQGVKDQYPGCEGAMNAATTETNPADFADRQQALFVKKMLTSLKFNLKLAGYGQSEGYTPNGRSIRFFRPRKANLSGINAEAVTAFTLNITPASTPTALTQGVAPTNISEVAIGYVDIYQGQRMGISHITDVASALDLFNTVSVHTKVMGEDAALDYDSVIRNCLINGVYASNATYATGDGGYFERFAGVKNTGASATDWGTMSGIAIPNAVMGRLPALGMVTQLKRSKIPKIGGMYVGVVAPEQIHDMRKDETWLKTAQQQDKNALFKDLAFTLDGVAYVEANNPWIEATVYGTEYNGTDAPPGDGLIYSAIFLGADAFGIPKLSNTRAGGGGATPKISVLDKPEKSDPGNQLTKIVWKAMYGAAPLIAASRANEIAERPRYGVLRTKSTFI